MNFTTVLQLLWKYINSIGLLAQTTSNTSIGTLIILMDEIKYIAGLVNLILYCLINMLVRSLRFSCRFPLK